MDVLFTDVLIVGGGPSAMMAVHTLIQENDSLRIIMATPGLSGRDSLPLRLPGPDISWEQRVQDTIRAGAGQCDPALVRILCREGPDMLRQLTQWGIGPDSDREELTAALYRQTYAKEQRLTALRLFVRDGRVQGALCADDQHRFVAVSAGAVLLACGGYGEIGRAFPIVGSMGDAVGMAYYAGAAMTDLEFLWFPPDNTADGGTPLTLGGLIIDGQCRATVPGLWAAGGCTAGVHGAGLIPGNEVLSALIFGQRAGRAIAKEAPLPGADAEALSAWAEELMPVGDQDVSAELEQLRREMGAALRAGAGPVRDQASVEAALQTASHLQHELNELPPCPAAQWYSRLRLENDLIAARLTLLASMERRESVGLYRRSDHPASASAPYRVRLQLTGLLLFPEKEPWPPAP